jgi:uncharacterized protein (DUF2062 family)
MTIGRTLRYQWLKFRRLQGDPRKLAGGMALGVFIGVTPTVPFHTVSILFLAPLLRVSPVTALLGCFWVSNPLLLAPLYLLCFKVGKALLFAEGALTLPATYDLQNLLQLMWQGGLALQVGGLVLAVPAALISYFPTLWAVEYYRRRKAQKIAGGLRLSQNPSATSGPEA